MPCHRVLKKNTHQTNKTKRGRPKKYSESWTKKLILLRACRLKLGEIVRMLKIQSDDDFEANLRRNQQIIRQYLGEGQERFCIPDKMTARKCAAFLRATMPRNGEPEVDRRQQIRASKTTMNRPTSSLEGFTPRSEKPSACPIGPSSGESKECSDTLPKKQSPRLELAPSALHTPSSEETNSTTSTHCKDDFSARSVDIHTGITQEAASNRDSTVLLPSRRHRIREAISQASYSPSFISNILSLLDKRFSMSTFSSSDRYTISVSSIAETEINFSNSKAVEVYEQSVSKNIKARDALTRACCSKSKRCRHRYVEDITRKDPFLTNSNAGNLGNLLKYPSIRPSPDIYGNSDLFSIARAGAPPGVIFRLIETTKNLNELNADGQTFLFFLNTREFHNGYCSLLHCTGGLSHTSLFECLIRILERRKFDFDCLDIHGRHFLTFMCSSPTFDFQWLSHLVSKDSQWDYRVWRASQTRDATGLFLINFMALHPIFPQLDYDMHSRCSPGFVNELFHADQPGTLLDELEHGQTCLHQYVQGDFLYSAALFGLPIFDNAAFDINRYSTHGRTPLMDFLQRAFEQGLQEKFICTKAKQLIRYGANVNACSRGGSTVLHFAAKKALPHLLALFLKSSCQADRCDNDGLTAMDYAAKVFHRSRSAKAPPELTARALKSLLTIIPYAFGDNPRVKFPVYLGGDRGYQSPVEPDAQIGSLTQNADLVARGVLIDVNVQLRAERRGERRVGRRGIKRNLEQSWQTIGVAPSVVFHVQHVNQPTSA